MDRQPLILIVEQNLQNLELVNSHLKALNLRCICTKQGAKTLLLAQTHHPNLILLDIMLHDLSSMEIINYLKQNSQTAMIPIIAVLPEKKAQNPNFILRVGADDTISKPYNFSDLEIVIRHHLSQQQSSDSPSE
ncbi:MAG: PleD family two-component system response regulator [Heteroscytonema crispum UTEX LB 1556]